MLRKQTRERHQNERRVEVLSALSSRPGDVSPQVSQNQINFTNLRAVNRHGQLQAHNPWNNMFLLKSLLVLMSSGFVEGYDLGLITFANLYV